MKENKKTSKIKLGFLVALGCCLIQAIPFSVTSNIHPQFLPYIIQEEGFALGAISLMFTVGTVISAIFSPTIGNLLTKYPVKLIFTIGAIVSASGVAILGIAGENLWLFYLGYGIAQIGTAAISSLGAPVLVSSWFDESVKGKALGIIFASGGVGNFFLQMISVNWITKYGYSEAYIRFAVLSVIVGILVALLFIRTPKDKSEIISSKKVNKEEVEEVTGYAFAEVKNLKTYWIFAVGFIFIGIYVSALATQYITYLSTLNFDKQILGVVGSVFAACTIIGNLMGGTLYDKFGSAKTTIIGFVLATTACLSMIFVSKAPVLAYVFSVTSGLAVFAYILAPSMLTGTLFGSKELGTKLGVVQLFFAVGFAIGSALFGVIVDMAGYPVAWSTMLVAIIVAYTILLSAIKSMNSLKKENNK